MSIQAVEKGLEWKLTFTCCSNSFKFFLNVALEKGAGGTREPWLHTASQLDKRTFQHFAHTWEKNLCVWL